MPSLFKTKSKTLYLSLCLPLLPLSLGDINEYLDVGTGSLLIQILIASFLGGAFMIKLFWANIKAYFRNIRLRIKNRDDKS